MSIIGLRRVPLPITVEIHRLLAAECQLGDALQLIAVGDAAVVLAPRRLLRKPQRYGPKARARLILY
jgi:hypothetical protein